MEFYISYAVKGVKTNQIQKDVYMINLACKRINIRTSLELLYKLGCAGLGHVLWEGISGDLGTGQGQGVDQGAVQKLVLLL